MEMSGELPTVREVQTNALSVVSHAGGQLETIQAVQTVWAATVPQIEQFQQYDSGLTEHDVATLVAVAQEQSLQGPGRLSHHENQKLPRSISVASESLFFVHLIPDSKWGRPGGTGKTRNFAMRVDLITGEVNVVAAMKVGRSAPGANHFNPHHVVGAIQAEAAAKQFESRALTPPSELVVTFNKGFQTGSIPNRAYLFQPLADMNGWDYLHRSDASVTDLLWVGREVAYGLAEMHAKGMAHRDVKPANVLIYGAQHPYPVVKLGDFGETTLADAITIEDVRGTNKYLPPDVLDNSRPATQADDLYALGVMLAEGLERVSGQLSSEKDAQIQGLVDSLRDPNLDARPTANEAYLLLNTLFL